MAVSALPSPDLAVPDPAAPFEARDTPLIDAFHVVASAALRHPNLKQTLQVAVSNACELFGVDRCSVFLRDPDSQVFHGVAAETPGDRDIVHRMRCGVTADRMSQEIITTQCPVLVRDAVRDGRPVRSTMINLRVKEVLGVPLVVHREVHGLLFLDQVGHCRRFTSTEMSRVARYADLMAGLLPVLYRMDELRSTIQVLEIQAHEAAKTRAFIADIARLSRTGTTPHEIAAAASAATRRGCWVTDGAHRPMVQGGDPHDGARIARILARPATIAALRSLPDEDVLDLSAEPDGLLIAPITVHGGRWGHVTLTCAGRSVTRYDKEVLLSAAHAMAVELRLETGWEAAIAEARQLVARALVDGNLDTATRRRATLHSIPLDRPRVVCLVAHQRQSAIPPDAHFVAQAFNKVHDGPPVLAAPTADGSVAVLVDLDTDTPQAVAERASALAIAALHAVDADDNLIAAVSTQVDRAEHIPRAHTESQRVLHCLRQLCPDSRRVLTADELGFASVLLGAIDRASADLHVHKALGRLLSDEARDRELIHTADVFLGHARNIRDTARSLGIHENTVRYRLTRIHDVTGLDLTRSADDQVSCQLALLILRLRGQMPTTTTANPRPR